MKLNGKVIIIEGTDGSGKQTQTAKLKEKIEASGQGVYSTSFPNYESDSSALVKMYLKGEIAATAEDVKAEAASIFYAADRYITYKRDFKIIYEEGQKTLLFDRYSASNIIHQGAKIISEYNEETELQQIEEKLISFVKWLDRLEHVDMGIPRADIVIYLNVPIEYTIKLREGRENKITGEQKQDIHESDLTHLVNANKAGLIAAKILGWKVIECVKDDEMRSIEDISNEIWETIKSV